MSKTLVETIFNKIYNKNFYILKESKISEGLRHHVENNIPISENVFRMGSLEYFKLFVEARKCLNENKIIFLSENDKWLLNNTDIGYFSEHEGNIVPLDFPFEFVKDLNEAEYRGKKVKLNKPKRTSGGKKKFVVYTKKPAKKTKNNKKGYRIVKVGFGQPGMKISKNAAARKSFLARHKCDTNPGPKWKARYWSCNIHRYKKQLGLKFPGRW